MLVNKNLMCKKTLIYELFVHFYIQFKMPPKISRISKKKSQIQSNSSDDELFHLKHRVYYNKSTKQIVRLPPPTYTAVYKSLEDDLKQYFDIKKDEKGLYTKGPNSAAKKAARVQWKYIRVKYINRPLTDDEIQNILPYCVTTDEKDIIMDTNNINPIHTIADQIDESWFIKNQDAYVNFFKNSPYTLKKYEAKPDYFSKQSNFLTPCDVINERFNIKIDHLSLPSWTITLRRRRQVAIKRNPNNTIHKKHIDLTVDNLENNLLIKELTDSKIFCYKVTIVHNKLNNEKTKKQLKSDWVWTVITSSNNLNIGEKQVNLENLE